MKEIIISKLVMVKFIMKIFVIDCFIFLLIKIIVMIKELFIIFKILIKINKMLRMMIVFRVMGGFVEFLGELNIFVIFFMLLLLFVVLV